ncbi:MAG: type II toxin-antitoxin system Phd/YefM family antitoxin [Myxococcota bacterium]
MSETVNIQSAEGHLSQLVDRAAAGEEIILARDGKPVARLVAFEQPVPRRKPGLWKGKIWVADDFDAPLPPDVLDAFYKGPIFPPDNK